MEHYFTKEYQKPKKWNGDIKEETDDQNDSRISYYPTGLKKSKRAGLKERQKEPKYAYAIPKIIVQMA